MDSDSGESGSQFIKSEKSAAPEVCTKWATVIFKIYERMIHSSEVSFFISSPQMISSLGFILGVCNLEETKGIVKCFSGDDNNDINFLIDHTLKFVHEWSEEFRDLLVPGQYHWARRVYAHRRFVNPHNENTFQFFRVFQTQEKIFEGFQEVRHWAAKTLEADFSQTQKMVTMWSREIAQLDRMEQKMTEDLSSKVRPTIKQKKKEIKKNIQSARSKKDPRDEEKKAPILAWVNHAVVEIPDEYFDGNHIYTWNRKEYLRIHESPAEPIRVHKGKFDFNTIIVPTQNRQLVMLIFYGFDEKLCSLEEMRLFVSNYLDSKGPCIIKKLVDTDSSTKRSIYLPHWKVKDFPPSRIAQHLMATIDLNTLFVSGGFGDLAFADAIPSASGDPKKISHLQHFGLLSFRNCPKKEASKSQESEPLLQKNYRNSDERRKKVDTTIRIPIDELNAKEVEIVPYPVCVILWDRNRELPAYMGKVTGKMTEQEIEELKQAERAKQQKKMWLCC